MADDLIKRAGQLVDTKNVSDQFKKLERMAQVGYEQYYVENPINLGDRPSTIQPQQGALSQEQIRAGASRRELDAQAPAIHKAPSEATPPPQEIGALGAIGMGLRNAGEHNERFFANVGAWLANNTNEALQNDVYQQLRSRAKASGQLNSLEDEVAFEESFRRDWPRFVGAARRGEVTVHQPQQGEVTPADLQMAEDAGNDMVELWRTRSGQDNSQWYREDYQLAEAMQRWLSGDRNVGSLSRDEQLTGFNDRQEIGRFGTADRLQGWSQDAGSRMEKNPFEHGTLNYYLFSAGDSLPNFTLGVGAGLLTRNPTLAASLVAAPSAADAYSRGLEKGLSHDTATVFGALYGAAELLPQKMAFSAILNTTGKSIIKGALRGAVAEGLEEAVTSVLQMGLDAGFLDDKPESVRDALRQVLDSAIVGAILGGPAGGVAAGVNKVTVPQTQEEAVRELRANLEDLKKAAAKSDDPFSADLRPAAGQAADSTQPAPVPEVPGGFTDDEIAVIREQNLSDAEAIEGTQRTLAQPNISDKMRRILLNKLATLRDKYATEPSPPGADTVADTAEDTAPSFTEDAAPADAPTAPRVTGRESTVLVDNQELPTVLEVVDAADLRADVAGTQNQFRDRSRQDSEIQVQRIADNLRPQQLGDSDTLGYGAPTLAQDGSTIIAGNGRTLAIQRAYREGKADGYRQHLIDNADSYGVSADQVAAMQSPVLVRRITTPVNIERLAAASNEDSGLAMSELENARADAARLPDLSNLEVDDLGNFNTAANRGYFRAFVSGLPQAQRNALLDADGQLSSSGLRRLRNAILQRVYGNSPVLSRIVESADPDLRNMLNAMVQVAPRAAQIRSRIEAGNLPDVDIAVEVAAAVDKLNQLHNEQTPVSSYLDQMGIFGDDLSETSQRLLVYLDQNRRSAKAIRDLLNHYYDALDAQPAPNQGDLLGGVPEPTTGGLLSEAETRRAAASVAPQSQQSSSADRTGEGPRYSTAAEAQGRPLSSDRAAQARAVLERALGKPLADTIVLTDTLPDGTPLVNEGAAFRDGRVYINPAAVRAIESDGRVLLDADGRVAFVAWHELVHRGVGAIQQRPFGAAQWQRMLGDARRNPAVRQLATAIMTERRQQAARLGGDVLVNEDTAVEEALAEIEAAIRTDSIDALVERYGGFVRPASLTGIRAAINRMAQSIRAVVGRITGRKQTDATLSAADAVAILREINQAALGWGVSEPAPTRAGRAAVRSTRSPIDRSGPRDAPVNGALYSTARDVKEQFNAAAEQYGGVDAYEAAKAAGETQLTYRQWVQVRTPSFKEWFGDWENDPANASKVVNERTGEPLVVYHGGNFNPEADHAVFDKERQGENYWESRGGFFFTNRKSTANNYALLHGGFVTEAFINLRHPETGIFEDFYAATASFDTNSADIMSKYIFGHETDHDGVYYRSAENDGNLVVATQPNQIKSATDNSGAFSTNEESILYSTPYDADMDAQFAATAAQYGGESAYAEAQGRGETVLDYRQWVQVRTPAFKAWFGDWENDPENASQVVHPRTGEPRVVWHGTTQAGFTEFSPPIKGKTRNTGFFFADSEYGAMTYSVTYNEARDFSGVGYAANYGVFLNIRQPFSVDAEGGNWASVPWDESWEVFDTDGEFADWVYSEEDAVAMVSALGGSFEHHKSYATTDEVVREVRGFGWADGVIFDNIDDSGSSHHDFEGTVFVALNPNQIKSATDNVGSFDPTTNDILYSVPIYSALSREVAAIDMKQGTGKAWDQRITGLLNSGKVKPDEVEWSGIRDYLATRENDRVSKDAVLHQLSVWGVTLNTTDNTEGTPTWVVTGTDGREMEFDTEEEAQNYYDSELEWIADNVRVTVDDDESVHFWDNDHVTSVYPSINYVVRGVYYDPDEVVDALSDWVAILNDSEDGNAPYALKARDDGYAIVDANGDDYEFYEAQKTWDVDDYRDFSDIDDVIEHFENMAEASRDAYRYGMSEPEEQGGDPVTYDNWSYAEHGSNYQEKLIEADARGMQSYRGTHWGSNKVIAHYRTVDFEAGRTLHVGEIQSDWAQAYRDDKTNARAPFVDNTGKWLDLTLKHILRDAVNGDYDRITIIDGDSVNERFGLENSYRKLRVTRMEDGSYKIEAVPHQGHIQVHNTDNLQSALGHELSEKILATQPDEYGGHVLEGDDLRTGGEPMRQWYNSMIPRALVKLVRKLDKNATITPRHIENIGKDQLTLEITPTMREKLISDGLPLFSVPPIEDALIARHGISEAALLHAARMGGIAAPSVAISRASDAFDRYGEITLIGTRTLVDPKGPYKSKVFGADIYSPRYPSWSYEITNDMLKRMGVDFAEGVGATGSDLSRQAGQYEDPRDPPEEAAIQYHYLKDIGVRPKIVRVKKPSKADVAGYLDMFKDGWDGSVARSEAFADRVNVVAEKKLLEDINKATSERTKKNLERILEEQRERGVSYITVDHIARNVKKYFEDLGNVGGVDVDKTKDAIRQQVRSAKGSYTAWWNQYLRSRHNPKERILTGYTYTGNRRYAAHNNDNVLKMLLKNLRGGEADGNSISLYGASAARAQVVPQFKSVPDIQASRGKLVDSEAFDKLRAEANNRYYGLGEFFDSVDGAVASYLARGARSLDDYITVGVDPDEAKLKMAAFMDYLRDMPTEYFEVKVPSIVQVGDFAAAVVPKTIGKDALQVLKDAGVKVHKYDPRDPGSRQSVIEKVSSAMADKGVDVLFSTAPNPADMRAEGRATANRIGGMAAWRQSGSALPYKEWVQAHTPTFAASRDATVPVTPETMAAINDGSAFVNHIERGLFSVVPERVMAAPPSRTRLAKRILGAINDPVTRDKWFDRMGELERIGKRSDMAEGVRNAFRGYNAQVQNDIIKDIEPMARDAIKTLSDYFKSTASKWDRYKGMKRKHAEAMFLDDVDKVGKYIYHGYERNAEIAARTNGEDLAGSGLSDAQIDEVAAFFRASEQGGGDLLGFYEQFYRSHLKPLMDYSDRRLRDAGLLTERMEAARPDYQWYVPLYGKPDLEDPALSQNIDDAYRDKGGGRRKNEVLRNQSYTATGRHGTEAHSLLETVFTQAEVSIRRARMQEPKRRLWEYGNTEEGASAFGMEVETRTITSANSSPVGRTGQFTWKTGDAAANQIVYQDGDVAHIMTIENEAALQAVRDFNKPLLPFDGDIAAQPGAAVWHASNRLTRFMGSMYTRFSPSFILKNKPMDSLQQWQYLLADAPIGGSTEARGVRGYVEAAGNVASRVPLMLRAARYNLQWTAVGALDKSYQEWLDRYAELGGVTTYTRFLTHDQLRNLHRDFHTANGPLPWRTGDLIGNAFAAINDHMELTTRVSAFRALVESGVPDERAAHWVKDVMNFEVKGDIGKAFNGVYPFFTTTLYDARRLGKTLTKKEGQIVMLAMTGASMLMWEILAQYGGEDEDGVAWVDKYPMAQAARNFIVPIVSDDGVMRGEGVRLPIGFGMGRLANTLALAARRLANGTDDMGGFVSNLVNHAAVGSFSPLQPSDVDISSDPGAWVINTFAPQVVKPIAQFSMNKNWRGSPIYDSGLFRGEGALDHNSGFAWTADTYKGITEKLYNTTNGRIDIAPESVQFFVQTALGGLGTDVVNSIETVVDQVGMGNQSTATRAKSWPVLGGFIQTSPSEDRERYYKYRDRVGERANKALVNRQRGLDDRYLDSYHWKAQFDAAEKKLLAIRKAKKAAREGLSGDALREAERRFSDMELRIQQDIARRYEEQTGEIR